jgi:glutamine synthetase
MGIGIEYHHHEVAPSQHEIDMPRERLDMADQTVTYRPIVRGGAKNGVYATFMPKPLFGENGSGMHTQGRCPDGCKQFFDGTTSTACHRPASSSSPAYAARARAFSVFAQWVTRTRARAGLEAPVCRPVAAQPVGPDPHPALQAGPEQATRWFAAQIPRATRT